jgi:hypothetical protein
MTDAPKQNLDGTVPIKPTPFDAHEQATRGQAPVVTKDTHPGSGEEYPKALEHDNKGEVTVVAKDAAEEAAYNAAKAKE